MKPATLPVDPKLRDAEDDLLAQRLLSAQQALAQDHYIDAQAVIAKLEVKLNAARNRAKPRDAGR